MNCCEMEKKRAYLLSGSAMGCAILCSGHFDGLPN